jgi:hypothetical protein
VSSESHSCIFCLWNSKVTEKTFDRISLWEMPLHFIRFYDFYAARSMICRYEYWLPLEWYCIFLEAGSANSITAILSGKNGKTNSNSFCFVSVFNAIVLQILSCETQNTALWGEILKLFHFNASISTEKLVWIITVNVYSLTELQSMLSFNDKSVQTCRELMHFFKIR